MSKCLKFIVKGKVQGVYYRKYTSLAMNKENIVGYIKNLTNSNVESIEIFDCNEDIKFSNDFEIRY